MLADFMTVDIVRCMFAHVPAKMRYRKRPIRLRPTKAIQLTAQLTMVYANSPVSGKCLFGIPRFPEVLDEPQTSRAILNTWKQHRHMILGGRLIAWTFELIYFSNELGFVTNHADLISILVVTVHLHVTAH
jgi:hypothetical protein